MSEKTTVNQILTVGGSPVGAPQVDVGDLLFSDNAERDAWAEAWSNGSDSTELRGRLEALYRFGHDVQLLGDNRKPVGSPADVIFKLARERQSYPAFHWVVWPLDAQRLHMFKLTAHGTRQYQRHVSKLVPRASELPPAERGGGYVLIYTGPPEAALEKEGARRALAELCQETSVLDVLFRKYAGKNKILYSTRAREGYYKASDGSDAIEAFDPALDLDWFQAPTPTLKRRS